MNFIFKKSSSLFVVLAVLVISLFTFKNEVNANMQYKDIPTNHWAYNTIQEATKLGYFKGDGNGYFHPENNVTRAEFAQILARLFDGTERTKSPFTDVEANHWGKDAIEELLALGIINANDYSKQRFEPTKAMTRNELSKWLTNALSVKQPEYATIMTTIRDSEHTLLPTTEYLRGGIAKADQGYIGVMLGTGLFTGYIDGSFKPTGNTSRSEVATLAIRFKNMQDKAPTSFKGLNELVEVAETGSNLESATNTRYINERSFANVVNKDYTLYTNLGKTKLKRMIAINMGNDVQSAMNNSIYGKMFITEEIRHRQNRIYLFVEQEITLSRDTTDIFDFSTGIKNMLIYPQRLTVNVEKYNLITLPVEQTVYQNFFKVGVPKTYWNLAIGSENYPFTVRADDGSVMQFNVKIN